MDNKKKKKESGISVEVPHIDLPEVQSTEYVFTKHGKIFGDENNKAENSFNVPSKSDVLGSYTGVPENKYEVPVQDADDL